MLGGKFLIVDKNQKISFRIGNKTVSPESMRCFGTLRNPTGDLEQLQVRQNISGDDVIHQ